MLISVTEFSFQWNSAMSPVFFGRQRLLYLEKQKTVNQDFKNGLRNMLNWEKQSQLLQEQSGLFFVSSFSCWCVLSTHWKYAYLHSGAIYDYLWLKSIADNGQCLVCSDASLLQPNRKKNQTQPIFTRIHSWQNLCLSLFTNFITLHSDMQHFGTKDTKKALKWPVVGPFLHTTSVNILFFSFAKK